MKFSEKLKASVKYMNPLTNKTFHIIMLFMLLGASVGYIWGGIAQMKNINKFMDDELLNPDSKLFCQNLYDANNGLGEFSDVPQGIDLNYAPTIQAP